MGGWKKYLEKIKNFLKQSWEKYRNIIIAFLILITVIIGWVFFFSAEKNSEQTAQALVMCKIDEDCALYDCTSCGNKHRVEKKALINKNCSLSVPGLIGCKCVDQICKRKYQTP